MSGEEEEKKSDNDSKTKIEVVQSNTSGANQITLETTENLDKALEAFETLMRKYGNKKEK